MPPYGLYAVPRHHLYGQQTRASRPRSFNTLDELTTPAAAVVEEAALRVNSLLDSSKRAGKKDKKEKENETKDNKKKDKKNKDKPKNRVSKPKKHKNGEENNEITDSSAKKRKRKRSEDEIISAEDYPGNVSEDFVAGTTTWLQSLRASVGDVASYFQQPDTAATALKEPASQSNTSRNLPMDPVSDTAVGYEPRSGRLLSKEPSRHIKPSKIGTANQTGNGHKTTAAYSCTTPLAQEPSKSSTLKNTPVPLPQGSVSDVASTAALDQRRKTNVGAAIPFSLASSSSLKNAHKRSKKDHDAAPNMQATANTNVLGSSPPTSHVVVHGSDMPSSPTSLKFPNTLQYRQPLNDLRKPYSRQRTSSVAPLSTGSSSSSVSSLGIREAFTRAEQLYSSDDSSASMSSRIKQQKSQFETHEESDVATFNELYQASQQTINFSDETVYLTKHLQWHANYAAIPNLPCLNKATGCSTKGEQMLRLAKEDMSNLFKLVVSTEQDQVAFDHAVRRSLEAESFLRNAVVAKVPVPIGTVEGVYSLYCPKYSATHADKYGFGQRTISFARPSGFKGTSAYTARLSIPPRSMAYTMLAFEAPPHASFRATTLVTSAEGYEMDVVFLGNGYLQLRVDLGLLLLGRKSEEADNGGVMEFLGVRDKCGKGETSAVEWVDTDEVHNGSVPNEAGNTVVVEQERQQQLQKKKKKKRGRPSNAERERRAQEAALSSEL